MNDDYTPVYTPGGTVTHFLDLIDSPNNGFPEALCGRTPWPSPWHGTGSQDELDRAQDLSRCPRCEAVMSHRKGWVA